MGRLQTQETKDKIKASMLKHYAEHPEACELHRVNIKYTQTKEARAKAKASIRKFWNTHPERKIEYSVRRKKEIADTPGYQTGKKNPNWNGGTQFEPYPIEFSHENKERIRDRDERKCQICKLHEAIFFRALCVHHIDYDKQNCKDSNLISLCDVCHTATNANREYWQYRLQLSRDVGERPKGKVLRHSSSNLC